MEFSNIADPLISQIHKTQSTGFGTCKVLPPSQDTFLYFTKPTSFPVISDNLLYPSIRCFLNSNTISALMRQGENLRSLQVYSCPAASAHILTRAAASSLPITCANSKPFAGFPWFLLVFWSIPGIQLLQVPPWFVQGCSETAKQQSARLVHHLHRSWKLMVMSSQKKGEEEGEKKKRQRAKLHPFRKESERE